MKVAELKNKTIEELEKELVDLKKSYEDNRFKLHTNELSDISSIKKQRRDIARVLTVINEKRSAE